MTDVRWADPEWHTTIDSTNAALAADPRPGRVVVADHQSAGQGRRGRTWVAPPGAALAVSVAFPAPAGELRSWAPLFGGLAVVRALAAVRWPVSTRLKWPNDVLAGEAPGAEGKICGVLAQSLTHPDHGDVVVLGAGLNIDQDADQLATVHATSWRLVRGQGPLPVVARKDFLDRYLHEWGLILQSPDEARQGYRDACDTLGREVLLHLPGERRVHGRAVDIAPDGALILQGPGGRRRHHAGDVVHLRSG